MVVSEVIDLVAPLIHSGGGGGGDWTSAEVTFICSANSYIYTGLCVLEGEYGGGALTIRASESVKVEIPLYKGVGYILTNDLEDIDFEVIPSLMGGIRFDDVGFKVTGDGSITIAGVSQG